MYMSHSFKCLLYFQNHSSVIVQEENFCPSHFLQTVEIGTFVLQVRRTHHRSRLHGPGMCSRHLIIRFVYFHDSACAALVIFSCDCVFPLSNFDRS